MAFTTVLFDLDGTLTDPLVGIANSVRHALSALGLPTKSDDELRAWVGPPLRGSFASLGLSPAQVEAAVAYYRKYFADRGLFENKLYAGIAPMLADLTGAGLPLAVATSKPTVFAERILEHFGIASHFREVVGDELDGSRGSKKAVIVEALARLRRAPGYDVLMVGDREHDILGAAAAGVSSAAVTWGYGTAEELAAASPTITLHSPDDLNRDTLAG